MSLVAGGAFDAEEQRGGAVVLEVESGHGSPDWCIAQSPFMRDHARTVGFRHKLTLEGSRLRYFETTSLEIYGRSFEHTDENELTRA